jgi:hypothetical protein
MKRRPDRAKSEKTQEKWPSSMAPAPKWRNSGACGGENYDRKPWVPEPVSGGCHVTQHNPMIYGDLSPQHPCVRCITIRPRPCVLSCAATSSLRCLAPEGARPFPGTGKVLFFSPAARRQDHSCEVKRRAMTSWCLLNFAPDPGDCEHLHIPRYWGRRADHPEG